jgi:hypothetical protein
MSQSIDLTRLPIPASPPSKSAGPSAASNSPEYEYSSREVSPSPLLLQQLISAHGVFLLHNGTELGHLFDKLERSKFCNLLDRFWTRFAQNWNVLLHGNPAVDVFGGLKLSAGGELGIGVGEEEWGSGEREVLEDFAGRTDGLVDLVVSRFGEPSIAQLASQKKAGSSSSKQQQDHIRHPWMGASRHAEAVDGIFFSGVGTISRSSLRDISHWTEWIYAYGDHAYGVKENPISDRRKRKRRSPVVSRNGKSNIKSDQASSTVAVPKPPDNITPPGIPPPIVSAVERSLARATSAHEIKKSVPPSNEGAKSAAMDSGVWMKYLTMGYGSAWGGTNHTHATLRREGSSTADDRGEDEATPFEEQSMQHLDPEPDIDHEAELEDRLKTQVQLEENGHFIIGLKGDLENDDEPDDDDDAEGAGEIHQRIMLRTLHVKLLKKPTTASTGDEGSASPGSATPNPQGKERTRLRVVVYVHRPFIYTFLFLPRASNLSLPAFYRNLHTFFAPLHRPLSASTSPARVADRIAAASRPYTTSPPQQAQAPGGQAEQTMQPIFDIVYDPRSLSVHASIPNIPVPGTFAAEGLKGLNSNIPEGWSRAEALNVHSAILEIWRSTRAETSALGQRELERSVKTARGWWVVWMRLDDESSNPPQEKEDENNDDETSTIRSNSRNTERGDYFDQSMTSQRRPANEVDDGREAILVRRARDAIPEAKSKVRATSGMWGFGGLGSGSSGKDTGSGWGPARLAEGVGVDARRYVEGLLSLNR